MEAGLRVPGVCRCVPGCVPTHALGYVPGARYVWDVSRYVWDVSRYVSDVSRYVWHVSRYVWDVSRYVWDVSRHAWHVSRYVWEVSRYVWDVSKYVCKVSRNAWDEARGVSWDASKDLGTHPGTRRHTPGTPKGFHNRTPKNVSAG